MNENKNFRRCGICGRYMTPYINGAFGRHWTEYSCACGNYYKEDTRTMVSNKTEATEGNASTYTTLYNKYLMG